MLRFCIPSQFLSGNAARSRALLRGCPIDYKGKGRVHMKEEGLRAWPRTTEQILNIRRGLGLGVESLATSQQERPVAEPLKYWHTHQTSYSSSNDTDVATEKVTPKPGQLRILLEEAKEEMNGQLQYGKDSLILCWEVMDVRSDVGRWYLTWPAPGSEW